MTYRRRLTAQLHRLGREVTILHRTRTGADAFNNTKWGFDADPDTDGETETVVCMRTYPNRNTEMKGSGGDFHRDSPVFVFPRADAPDKDARIEYPEDDGTTTVYEMQAPTVYDTHVEMFGQIVTHE